MVSLFKKDSQGLLGIDIGSSSVKLLELDSSDLNGTQRIKRFAVVPLPSGAVDGKRIVEQDVVADALRSAVSQSGASTNRVAVAVSGVTVITKVLQMPSGLDDNELESMVEFEADQQIPQPLDEIRYDYEILGPTKQNPELDDVLLVASRGDVVDDLIATLEIAGLTPVIVDVESYAAHHCYSLCQTGDQEQAVALVDVGAATTDFHVMKGGNVIYSREYNFGGRTLTRELQSTYSLSPEEAERIKVEGEWPDDSATAVVEGFISSLVQEIRGALQIYRASSKGDDIVHLYLTGGCVALPGIEKTAGEMLDVPVSVLHPFKEMKHDKRVHIGRLNQVAPAMTIACGLATRRYG